MLGTAAAVSAAVALTGAALDFYSAYAMTAPVGGSMMEGTAFGSAVVLTLLGIITLGLGVAMVLPAMTTRMHRIGLGMELCGVAMALVSAWLPEMPSGISLVMLAFGGVMILSGALTQRRQGMATV